MTQTVEQRDSNPNKQGMRTIDADGHVVEYTIDLEGEYLDKEFRKTDRIKPGGLRAPFHSIIMPLGGLRTQVERGELDIVSLRERMRDAAASGDVDARAFENSFNELDAGREVAGLDERAAESRAHLLTTGGYDPKARVIDMDKEGIDVAVLYPTLLLGVIEDVGLFKAACRAYNNWLHEFCSEAPSRLYGVGLVPMQDIDAAIDEMRRVKELGFKAVMVRPSPYIGTYKLSHPIYNPFWKAAEDLDMPIGVHPYPFSDMINVCRNMSLDGGLLGGLGGRFTQVALSASLDMMIAVGWFVGEGISANHPKLKVAFLEATGGWIYPMLERFEAKFHYFGSADQKMPPMEIFQRQCWMSFDFDEEMLPFTAEKLGADRVFWASDYPHVDALVEGYVKELFETVEPLNEKDQRLVVGESAAAFYGIS